MCNYQATQENRLTLHKRSAHAIKTDAEIVKTTTQPQHNPKTTPKQPNTTQLKLGLT